MSLPPSFLVERILEVISWINTWFNNNINRMAVLQTRPTFSLDILRSRILEQLLDVAHTQGWNVDHVRMAELFGLKMLIDAFIAEIPRVSVVFLTASPLVPWKIMSLLDS